MRAWFLGVLVLVLLLGVSGFFLVQQSGVGSTVLSLDKAYFKSTDSFFNGEVFVYSFRQGGLSQSAFGTRLSDTISSGMVDSDVKPEGDFKISVLYDEQVCKFPILRSNEAGVLPIYSNVEYLKYLDLGSECSYDEAVGKIPSGAVILRDRGGVPFLRGNMLGTHCFVMYARGGMKSPIGLVSDKPEVTFGMTISVDANGETASARVSNSGVDSVRVGDFSYAVLQGGFGTGKNCPSMKYKAAYVNGEWRIISEEAYDRYVAQFENLDYLDNANAWDVFVRNINLYGGEALKSVNFGNLVDKTSERGAVVEAEVANPVFNSVVTMYVKAETMGVYQPVPDVRLVSASSDCFRTGSTGVVRVGLKNVGEVGTGVVSLECPSGFSTGVNSQLSLGAGASGVVMVPLYGSSGSKLEANCNVRVSDGFHSYVRQVGVCVNPLVTCSANAVFCGFSGNAEAVLKCNGDGSGSSVVELCSGVEFCDDSGSVPACSSRSGGGSAGWDWLKTVFGVLGLLCGWFAVWKGLSMLGLDARRAGGLGFVAGVGFGLLSFFAWWWVSVPVVLFVLLVIVV